MNSIITKKLAGTSRLIPVLVSTFLCAAAANAAPTNSVTIPLATKSFGVGKDLKVGSGTGRIVAASKYKYTLSGSATVTGDIAGLFQPNVPFGQFLEGIRPGASALLTQTVNNTSGTRPATLLNKTIKGTKNVGGVNVNLSMNLKIHILAGGLALLEVSNVKVQSPAGALTGKVTFGPNSKLVVKKAS